MSSFSKRSKWSFFPVTTLKPWVQEKQTLTLQANTLPCPVLDSREQQVPFCAVKGEAADTGGTSPRYIPAGPIPALMSFTSTEHQIPTTIVPKWLRKNTVYYHTQKNETQPQWTVLHGPCNTFHYCNVKTALFYIWGSCAPTKQAKHNSFGKSILIAHSKPYG